MDEMNPELEKAGRVADFLELGELFAKDALQRVVDQRATGGCVQRLLDQLRSRDQAWRRYSVGEEIARGEGTTKREAQQQAARRALVRLGLVPE